MKPWKFKKDLYLFLLRVCNRNLAWKEKILYKLSQLTKVWHMTPFADELHHIHIKFEIFSKNVFLKSSTKTWNWIRVTFDKLFVTVKYFNCHQNQASQWQETFMIICWSIKLFNTKLQLICKWRFNLNTFIFWKLFFLKSYI